MCACACACLRLRLRACILDFLVEGSFCFYLQLLSDG